MRDRVACATGGRKLYVARPRCAVGAAAPPPAYPRRSRRRSHLERRAAPAGRGLDDLSGFQRGRHATPHPLHLAPLWPMGSRFTRARSRLSAPLRPALRLYASSAASAPPHSHSPSSNPPRLATAEVLDEAARRLAGSAAAAAERCVVRVRIRKIRRVATVVAVDQALGDLDLNSEHGIRGFLLQQLRLHITLKFKRGSRGRASSCRSRSLEHRRAESSCRSIRVLPAPASPSRSGPEEPRAPPPLPEFGVQPADGGHN